MVNVMNPSFSRREVLAALGCAAAVQTLPAADDGKEPFGYCLNTSTIRGQKLGIVEVIEIAARAGYRALEPWLNEIDAYVKGGGSLKDLGKRVADRGLSVESAIGFPEWLVDDENRRKKGLEDLKRGMDVVQQIGGKRIAAPPAGANGPLNLYRAAERYRAALEMGDQMSVVPELEFWGPSKALSRLSEAMMIAIETGHPRACILPDVYHLYKGGSGYTSLRLLSGSALHVIHMNDYPATPPRAEITDAQRVYPGDGVAPLKDILRTLQAIGFRGMLSLELFNRMYWQQDAFTVARTGLEKMRAAVKQSLQAP
jgi:sugar phosphate isomerase/epimerase